MRDFLRNFKHLLIVAAVFCGMAGAPYGGAHTQAQSARQLPTQIDVERTPADIAITGGLSQVMQTGDFNGDGVADFLVMYWKAAGNLGIITFQKFGIIFGKRNPSQPIKINLETDEPDLSLTTKLKGSFGASATTPFGDLNGDGIDDIALIQEPPSEIGQLATRTLKVIFGSSHLQPGAVDLDALQPDLAITFKKGPFFASIAGVADVNGDGAKDVVITENPNSTVFAAPILLGPFTAGETIDLNLQAPDVIIKANKTLFDNISRVDLGDVNGDGIKDILVRRSRLADPIGIFITTLDVVFGSGNLKPGVEVSFSDGQADTTITIGFDFPVISTGDVNGDGIDDIVMGVPGYSGEPFPPPWFAGSVRVIFGSPSIGDANRSGLFIEGLPSPQPLTQVFQTTLGDRLGESVGVGDINGDGVSDILIGAPGLTSDKKGRITYLSRAHIILGSTERMQNPHIQTALNQQDITISFDSKTSGVGRRVSSGDFNGDGVADILVGSDADSYIFFGAQLRAPEITKAKYHGGASELVVFGTDLTGSTRVEVNGVLLDNEAAFELAEGRLVVRGRKSELNLRNGKNRITVVRKGARSNTIKLKL